MTTRRIRGSATDSDPGLQVRAFLAIGLPASVRAGLGELTSALELASQGGKWVAEENLHLTIKFLGNLDDAALQRLGAPLLEAAASLPAFRVALGSLGAFPRRADPKVVWVGLRQGAEATAALHGSIDAALNARDLARPDRESYTPHVTLARARSRQKLVTEGDFFETLVPPEAAEPFLVDRVTLYMSELTRAGPIYTVMSEFPLRS